MKYYRKEIGVDLRYKFELQKGYKNIGIIEMKFRNNPKTYRGNISFCAIEYKNKMKLCVVTAAHCLYDEDP